LLTENPFKIFKIIQPSITPGKKADIILININKDTLIEKSSFLSRSSNSPFAGRKLKGEVICTIKDGKIAYKSNSLNRR